jgi:hypothetical protein
VTAYRVPARSGPADVGDGRFSVERWLCGVVASYEEWPQDRFSFRLSGGGLPLFISHEEQFIHYSGTVPGDVGAARRLVELEGIGVVALIEVSAPAVLLDVAQGKRTGLSVCAHVDDEVPVGPAWVWFSELSLTEHPVDPLARVVSTGQVALDDWLALTGEVI